MGWQGVQPSILEKGVLHAWRAQGWALWRWISNVFAVARSCQEVLDAVYSRSVLRPCAGSVETSRGTSRSR